MRYVHTNLVARDVERLVAFYVEVLGCRHIGQSRDICGEWLDRLVDGTSMHAWGEHLALPGYDQGPTLEIFQYEDMSERTASLPFEPGFTHIAFAVHDVEQVLADVLAHGGSMVGTVERVRYPGRTLTVVYARDPEGNVIELQRWDIVDEYESASS